MLHGLILKLLQVLLWFEIVEARFNYMIYLLLLINICQIL